MATKAKSKLYGRRWRQMRVQFLKAHPLCAMCEAAPANGVSHIKPHEGNPELFYDLTNLQGLCKACHKQSQDRTGSTTDSSEDDITIDPDSPPNEGKEGKEGI